MTNSDAVVVNIEDGKIRDTKKRHKEKKSRRKNLLTAFSAQEEPAEILPLRLDLTVDNEAKNESEKDDTKPVSEQPEKKNDSSVAVPQTEVFAAAEEFARVEGILPAPESSHAIKVALDEAKKCIETGEEKTIVFGLTGTGYFDMVAYEKFHDGVMDDYIPTDEELQKYFETLPKID